MKDPVVASIERLLPLMARAPALYNLVAESRLGRAAMKAIGLTALPSLPKISLSKELRRRGIDVARPSSLQRLSAEERSSSVVIVQDAFTSHFEPQLLLDTVDLVRRLGVRPFVAPLWLNGKALHVHGYLAAFTRTAERTAAKLRTLEGFGVPLVGLDPSMTLCYRQEYPAAVGRAKAPKVLLPQEWLLTRMDRLGKLRMPPSSSFVLLPHCSEQTNAGASVEGWGTIFKELGAELTIATVGCCGMAGTFGHEARNRRLSDRVFDLSWRPKLDGLPPGAVPMATGYSCRSQVAHSVSGDGIGHPIRWIMRSR